MELKPYRKVVNYYETDQMHVVHHSNYARYLEEARLDLMGQMGLGYDEMEEMGIIIPVLELHDYYKSTIQFGDVILIYPSIVKVTPVRFSLEYEIRNEKTGELVHTAMTSHAFVDSSFRPMNLKKKYPEVFESFSNLIGYQYS